MHVAVAHTLFIKFLSKTQITMPCQTGSGTEQNPTIWAGATTFDSLPTEIRFMIWEEFVRIPRIIHIDTRNGTKAGRGFACYLESMDSGLGRRVKSEQ
ncbi:hypothetical protein F4801DRAFT_556474, partial [Xylaria longipes]